MPFSTIQESINQASSQLFPGEAVKIIEKGTENGVMVASDHYVVLPENRPAKEYGGKLFSLAQEIFKQRALGFLAIHYSKMFARVKADIYGPLVDDAEILLSLAEGDVQGSSYREAIKKLQEERKQDAAKLEELSDIDSIRSYFEGRQIGIGYTLFA